MTPDEWFNQQIAEFQAARLPQAAMFNLGRASNLHVAGWKPLFIWMSQKTLRTKLQQHSLPISVVHNLPSMLQRPVMVFNSRTFPDAFNILVDRFDVEEILLIAMHRKRHPNLGQIHQVSSIYFKDRRAIQFWIDQGNLVYSDKEKSQVWLQDSAPSNVEAVCRPTWLPPA